MRPALLVAALLFALGGAVPALLAMASFAAVHILRSPDRTMDAAYAAAFCGLGYLVG